MKLLRKFAREDAGAVTVDWVVLTAATVGIGIAAAASVTGGTTALGGNISERVEAQIEGDSSFPTTTAWNGLGSQDYYAYGASLAPGNNGATYAWAQQAAADDAPDGFNFDDPLHDGQGNVIYTSTDGSHYSIAGEVTSVDSYEGDALYWGA